MESFFKNGFAFKEMYLNEALRLAVRRTVVVHPVVKKITYI